MSWSTTLLEFLCDRNDVTKSGVRLHLLHPSFQTFIECHGHKFCRVRECHCGDFARYFVFSSGGHSPITNTTLWFFSRTRTKPSAFFICATFIIVWGGKCWNFEESEQINNLHKQKSDTECYKINHQNLSIFLVSLNMGDPQTPQKLFISIPKLMDLGAPNF